MKENRPENDLFTVLALSLYWSALTWTQGAGAQLTTSEYRVSTISRSRGAGALNLWCLS